MTAINSPPLSRGGRIFTDFAMCNRFSKNLGLGEGSALPVGVPVPWPSATPPTGWLKCNGAAFSLAQYPRLAVAYPTGTLPDLRGVFIRGWDDGRGLDSGRAILSYAADKMRKHTHGFLFGNGDGTATPAVHEQSRKAAATTYYAVSGNSGVYITEEGQNETAPCNTAFNYIVRAA
ncbi:tail fiber protein [Enterobacter asburiae]|uniref:tail fiber protein n=2 Tax=Enterobacter asburiae TaxID=61645 RepID=UPI001F39D031|nr:tail fiber protein [Enterobacter asburiae]